MIFPKLGFVFLDFFVDFCVEDWDLGVCMVVLSDVVSLGNKISDVLWE